MRFERVQFAVIGAGISGLACAHRLAALGGDVIVLDAADNVGGRIETAQHADAQFEAGPNTLMAGGSAGAALEELIRELDLTDRVIEASPTASRRFIGTGRGVVPLPSGPLSALTSPLVGPRALGRAAADFFVPPGPMGGESVARFIRRRLGRRILDNLVAPFLSGVYAGDVSRLEAASVLPLLVEAEAQSGSIIRGMIARRRRERSAARAAGRPMTRPRCITFGDGLCELPRRLHDKLGTRVILGVRVEDVQEMPGGCDLFLGDGSRLRCEHAIIATDIGAAGALLARIPRLATLAVSLSEAPCAGLAVVSLVMAREDVPHPLDGFGYLNQPQLGRQVLGCMFRSSIFPHAAPKDSVMLSAFVGGACHPAALELSEAAILQLVRVELGERLGIAASASPRQIYIRRWRNAIPQFNSGHKALRQRIARSVRHGPISLVGNYISGLSLPDCIRGASGHGERLLPDASTRARQRQADEEASCASASS